MFNNYPQTSMQDMNLDWIIKISKESNNVLKGIEKQTESIVNKWIKENYARLILSAFYNEPDESIYLFTAMTNFDVHVYSNDDSTMSIIERQKGRKNMSLLKNINLNGTLLEIADTTARTNADNAITLANSAQDSADTALIKANKAQETADSKALITYTESEMTMYIK